MYREMAIRLSPLHYNTTSMHVRVEHLPYTCTVFFVKLAVSGDDSDKRLPSLVLKFWITWLPVFGRVDVPFRLTRRRDLLSRSTVMAKRRVAADSDDETLESSQVSKRAKIKDSDDDEVQLIPSSPAREKKPNVNGKAKGKARGNESTDDEGVDIPDADEENEEFEKRFEEENGAAIREHLEARKNVAGV